MRFYRRMHGFRKFAALVTAGVALQFPLGCDLGTFSTTTTTTLDGRQIVGYLARAVIITPIDNLLQRGIDKFFEQFVDQDN